MKRLKGLLVFVLIFISTVLLSSTKSFAAAVQYTDNVIPTMTSNTSPSGEASSSSEFGEGANGDHYPAYLAFNHTTSSTYDAWASKINTPAGWLAYRFPEAKCITKYTMISRNITPNNNILELPKSWTFEAYNESTGKWIILDTQANIANWAVGVKKEFTFTNINYYNKYRINIATNGNGTSCIVIGELEMMETVLASINLNATVENGNVQLSWNSVPNTSSYIIKRSTITGGPYTTIATGSAINFTDSDAKPGTTYYYVVSAIISGIERTNSNEASATPTEGPTSPGHIGNTATLILTMTNGDDKLYNLSLTELDNFLIWYDSKSDGTGKAYYVFTKSESIAPYVSVKDYVSFDKISSFEVKEYNQ